jgi:hypothetical protein
MIKNIAIAILVVLCGVLAVYGLVQKTDAQKSQRQAYENQKLAEVNALLAGKAEEEARKQQKLAEANAKEAHHQLLIAEQNLLECSQKKKARRQ